MSEIPSFDRARCSIAGTLGVVGEKWTLLVLRETFLGVRRFADFQRLLGIPRAVLTERLATLVEQGVLSRVPYQVEGERRRDEYRLTAKGLDLYPALVALMQWGDRYLFEGEAPPMSLTHRDCGAPVHLGLDCEAGHHVAGARNVRPIPATASSVTASSVTASSG